MKLSFRLVGKVDSRIKREIIVFGKWVRGWYAFTNPLEIRLVDQMVVVDFDGTECALRWWQSSRGYESVTAEIAVGSFGKDMENEGPSTAFPTVIAAIGRVMKYYFQATRNVPIRKDCAGRWGDKLLDA